MIHTVLTRGRRHGSGQDATATVQRDLHAVREGEAAPNIAEGTHYCMHIVCKYSYHLDYVYI